jgi:hypothetical protein
MSARQVSVLLLVSFFLLSYSVSAQQTGQTACKLAYPQMEVTECDSGESFTATNARTFQCSGSNCQISYTCIIDCTISVHVECGVVSGIKGQVLVNGNEIADLSKFVSASGTADVTGLKAGEADSILIKANCERLFVPYTVDTAKSYANIQDFNKYLYATNPDFPRHKIDDTKNCIPQSYVSNYLIQQVASGNLPSVYTTGGKDALGNTIQTPKNFQDISKLNLATELKKGDTISYFYKWVTADDINLRYDQNKNPVFCGGGTVGQKKLLSYSTIQTTGGSCYSVPSSQTGTAECCNDGDCSIVGKVCGPGFKCTDKKPCNSDTECGLQESQCSNNQLSSWTCDKSQDSVNLPSGETYLGWCSKQTRTVSCCPSSCQSGTHCEYDKGCVSDIRILDCPAGKCCKTGGSYKEQSCSSNLKCCPTADPIIGDCKSVCEPANQQSEGQSGSAITGQFVLPEGSNLITIVIVAIVAVGGIVGYIVWKNKQKEEPISGKKEGKDLLGGDI